MAEVKFTDQNFKEEVLKSKVAVLVDFWAPWCGPCQMMGPMIEEMAKEYDSKAVKIGKLNVDENPTITEKYNIMGIPAFKIFKEGKVVEEFVGAQAKEAIKEKIDKLL